MWGGWLVMDDRQTAQAKQRRDMAIADRWVTHAPRTVRRPHLRVVHEPDATRDRVVPDRGEGRATGPGVGRWARWVGTIGWGSGTVILAADLLSRWL